MTDQDDHGFACDRCGAIKGLSHVELWKPGTSKFRHEILCKDCLSVFEDQLKCREKAGWS